MSRAVANRMRVECGEDGSVRVVGAGFERPISLEGLASLARLPCRSRRRGRFFEQPICLSQSDRESLDAQ